MLQAPGGDPGGGPWGDDEQQPPDQPGDHWRSHHDPGDRQGGADDEQLGVEPGDRSALHPDQDQSKTADALYAQRIERQPDWLLTLDGSLVLARPACGTTFSAISQRYAHLLWMSAHGC